MDFSCGFQVNLSAGRRSRNLRVMGAWLSNSAKNSVEMGMVSSWGIWSCGEVVLRVLKSDLREKGNSICESQKSSGLFCALASLIVDVSPARDHAFLVVVEDEAEACVAELNQRFTALLAQPVLHV